MSQSVTLCEEYVFSIRTGGQDVFECPLAVADIEDVLVPKHARVKANWNSPKIIAPPPYSEIGIEEETLQKTPSVQQEHATALEDSARSNIADQVQAQEAMAAEQMRLENVWAEAMVLAQEQAQQLLEAERRTLLAGLEREKQDALDKALLADVERAALMEEREKMAAELQGERQKGAQEVAFIQAEIAAELERKLAAASK